MCGRLQNWHLVKLGDFINQLKLGNVSLHLHRWSEEIVLDGPWILEKHELLGLLQTVELGSSRKLHHSVVNSLDESFVLAQFCVKSLSVLFTVLFHGIRVQHDKANSMVSERIAVNPDLCDVWRLDVNVFQLFRGNVLSLRKFENVLCSVYNFH